MQKLCRVSEDLDESVDQFEEQDTLESEELCNIYEELANEELIADGNDKIEQVPNEEEAVKFPKRIFNKVFNFRISNRRQTRRAKSKRRKRSVVASSVFSNSLNQDRSVC